jgi:hypothetical protein
MAKSPVTGIANLATHGAASSVASATGISQDNIIFGMLLIMFIVFITLKGELRTYMSFFTPSTVQGPAPVAVAVGSAASTVSPTGSAQIPTTSVLGNNPISTVVNAVQSAGNTAGQATGIQQAFQGSSFGKAITGFIQNPLATFGF